MHFVLKLAYPLVHLNSTFSLYHLSFNLYYDFVKLSFYISIFCEGVLDHNPKERVWRFVLKSLVVEGA